MVNVIVVLDCDLCGAQFERTVVSFDKKADGIALLMSLAETEGWHEFDGYVRCRDCLSLAAGARAELNSQI